MDSTWQDSQIDFQNSFVRFVELPKNIMNIRHQANSAQPKTLYLEPSARCFRFLYDFRLVQNLTLPYTSHPGACLSRSLKSGGKYRLGIGNWMGSRTERQCRHVGYRCQCPTAVTTSNLVPGVGAQGGNLQDVCKYGMTDTVGLLINSSRGIIYAASNNDFAAAAAEKAGELQQEMALILG